MDEKGLCGGSAPSPARQGPTTVPGTPAPAKAPRRGSSTSCAVPNGKAWLSWSQPLNMPLAWGGDYVTCSDGYVRAFLGTKELRTETVWNTDNPVGNAKQDFGIVQMPDHFSKAVLQIWDEDLGWDDDLLGRCSQSLDAWHATNDACYLNHGHLYYRVYMTCPIYLAKPADKNRSELT
ncbi:hypothetical protein lerEdw1_013189 [Lerista edwardsae]|nr:hypothetical protein lerEdw1_013189 [Lerista edwardsae]